MPEPASTRFSRRRLLKVAAASGIGLALGGATVVGFSRLASLTRVRSTRTRMGTAVTLSVLHRDPEAAERLLERGFEEVDRLEAILSGHRPESALAGLNREGHLADPPPELSAVLRAALRYAELTRGAFDPTVGPLVELYRSTAVDGTGRTPSTSEIERTRSRVGFRDVRVTETRIELGRTGMLLSLDGLAKGYVLDQTARILVDGGAESALTEAGGDFAAGVSGGGTPDWHVAVQDPRDPHAALEIMRLRVKSLATSGDYADSYTADRRIHHLIDPRTGRSPDLASAATVLAPTAMEADALATAAMVLGPGEGRELLERQVGVEGLIVSKTVSEERRVVTTRGFDLHRV